VTHVLPLVPVPDPFATCVRFSGLPYLLFLDSSAQGALSRYSFLAADPVAVAQTPDAARDMLRAHQHRPLAGLPPFQGGIAGYVGYDWGAELEQVVRPPADRLTPQMPDVVLALYDWVIAWDHLEGRAWIISTGDGGRGTGDELARERLAWVRDRLGAPGPEGHRPVSPPPSPVPQSNFSRAEFEDRVSRIRDYIAAGDVYQVNLSQRFHAPFVGSALALYRRLRARNPAPFGAYLEFGGAQVASISPERFLRLDAMTRTAEARPIKGTRPRGTTATKDAALARELLESEKDRAENVMIVDLLRNDLGKVCRPGSVRVPKLFALESHPTVHHLVSTVTGELVDGAQRVAADVQRAVEADRPAGGGGDELGDGGAVRVAAPGQRADDHPGGAGGHRVRHVGGHGIHLGRRVAEAALAGPHQHVHLGARAAGQYGGEQPRPGGQPAQRAGGAQLDPQRTECVGSHRAGHGVHAQLDPGGAHSSSGTSAGSAMSGSNGNIGRSMPRWPSRSRSWSTPPGVSASRQSAAIWYSSGSR